MGLQMAGKKRAWQIGAAEDSNWRFKTVSHRVRGSNSGGCSSLRRQHSYCTKQSRSENSTSALGALFGKRTAGQGIIHAGLVLRVLEKLDITAMGYMPDRRSQDCRSRALVERLGSCRRLQGENQMRYVRIVFSRSAVGILRGQPDLFRRTGRQRRKAGTEYRRPNQCQAAKSSFGIVFGANDAGSQESGVPRSASRISAGRAGNPQRGTRRSTLAGLRFHQRGIPNRAFVLLETGWAFEDREDGGFGKTAPHASRTQGGVDRVEDGKSPDTTRRLRLPLPSLSGNKTAGSRSRSKTQDSAGFFQARNQWGGMAYFSPLRGQHAGGNGRASAYDPRLLAACQLARHQQVSSGCLANQTTGTGKVGGRNSAFGAALEEQIQPGPVSNGLMDPNGPKSFFAVLCK